MDDTELALWLTCASLGRPVTLWFHFFFLNDLATLCSSLHWKSFADRLQNSRDKVKPFCFYMHQMHAFRTFSPALLLLCAHKAAERIPVRVCFMLWYFLWLEFEEVDIKKLCIVFFFLTKISRNMYYDLYKRIIYIN